LHIGIDWCRGYPDRLYSLKAKAHAQRRPDRASRVRAVKRTAELRKRASTVTNRKRSRQ
jgi:hypothetical protein